MHISMTPALCRSVMYLDSQVCCSVYSSCQISWISSQQYQPQFDIKSTDVQCPSSRSDAMTFNVIWPTRTLTRRASWQPMKRTEKKVRLVRCIVKLFTLPERSVLDKYASAIAAGVAALANRDLVPTLKRMTQDSEWLWVDWRHWEG